MFSGILKRAFKNVSYTILANAVGFLVSSLVILIVPKFLDTARYGYFQLYLFYIGYIGLVNFGWPEGILLRYGGARYESLDKPAFKTQFLGVTGLSCMIGLLLCIMAMVGSGAEKSQVIIGVGLCIIVHLPRAFLNVLLQMTNRITEYAVSVIIEKMVFFAAVVALLLFGVRSFFWLIAAELIGRAVALAFNLHSCRDILLAPLASLKSQWSEIWQNIRAGINLMLAYIAGIFIIGIVRQFIESHWDIATFGKVSLTLSVSNLLMVFIRAVAVVLFPMLKRADEDRIVRAYGLIRTSLMIPVLAMLILYYPMQLVLSLWLPQYAESMRYMALLFPICVFESKMSMLIETYMKALRLERKLLMVNVVSVVLSLALSVVSVLILNNLTLAIFSILILVAFRCVFSECLLTAKMGLRLYRDIIVEVAVAGSFVLCSWFVGGLAGAAMYCAVYAAYFFWKLDDLKAVYARLKASRNDGGSGEV